MVPGPCPWKLLGVTCTTLWWGTGVGVYVQLVLLRSGTFRVD